MWKIYILRLPPWIVLLLVPSKSPFFFWKRKFVVFFLTLEETELGCTVQNQTKTNRELIFFIQWDCVLVVVSLVMLLCCSTNFPPFVLLSAYHKPTFKIQIFVHRKELPVYVVKYRTNFLFTKKKTFISLTIQRSFIIFYNYTQT